MEDLYGKVDMLVNLLGDEKVKHVLDGLVNAFKDTNVTDDFETIDFGLFDSITEGSERSELYEKIGKELDYLMGVNMRKSEIKNILASNLGISKTTLYKYFSLDNSVSIKILIKYSHSLETLIGRVRRGEVSFNLSDYVLNKDTENNIKHKFNKIISHHTNDEDSVKKYLGLSDIEYDLLKININLLPYKRFKVIKNNIENFKFREDNLTFSETTDYSEAIEDYDIFDLIEENVELTEKEIMLREYNDLLAKINMKFNGNLSDTELSYILEDPRITFYNLRVNPQKVGIKKLNIVIDKMVDFIEKNEN